ncbi:hypothetical protein evm_012263 [Chilo suppressalis]|nr:hypothetical protein evm_012263 [Chilo suppressalis]
MLLFFKLSWRPLGHSPTCPALNSALRQVPPHSAIKRLGHSLKMCSELECLAQVKKEGESLKLKKCASGEQANSILASYGDKTDAVQRPLGFVPTIVINEKYDQANQDEAFTNLKAVVCRSAAIKPSSC